VYIYTEYSTIYTEYNTIFMQIIIHYIYALYLTINHSQKLPFQGSNNNSSVKTIIVWLNQNNNNSSVKTHGDGGASSEQGPRGGVKDQGRCRAPSNGGGLSGVDGARWPAQREASGGRGGGWPGRAGAGVVRAGGRGPAWSGRAGGWPGRRRLLSRRRRRRFCEGTEREESEREHRREPASV
jgi:hypothetical protein